MEHNFEHTLPANWQRLVQTWLDEDLPGFDVGGYVVGDKEETAILYGKADGVLAGRPFFDSVFTLLNCQVCHLSKFAVAAMSSAHVFAGNRISIVLGLQASPLSIHLPSDV